MRRVLECDYGPAEEEKLHTRHCSISTSAPQWQRDELHRPLECAHSASFNYFILYAACSKTVALKVFYEQIGKKIHERDKGDGKCTGQSQDSTRTNNRVVHISGQIL